MTARIRYLIFLLIFLSTGNISQLSCIGQRGSCFIKESISVIIKLDMGSQGRSHMNCLTTQLTPWCTCRCCTIHLHQALISSVKTYKWSQWFHHQSVQNWPHCFPQCLSNNVCLTVGIFHVYSRLLSTPVGDHLFGRLLLAFRAVSSSRFYCTCMPSTHVLAGMSMCKPSC